MPKAKATKITGLTPAQEEALVREVYENFPEAGVCVSCTLWEYDEFRFVFRDEEGKNHVVRLPDAVRGLRLFAAAVSRDEFPGLGLPANYLRDTGAWDAFAFDALNQMAIFGEVIYG